MNDMRAARLYQPGSPLKIEQIPVPQPAADQLVVAVSACGLCGTDVHLAVAGDIPVRYIPITLGHEGAGVISAVGPDVQFFEPGQRVALMPSMVCGRCRFCEAGRESLCRNGQVYGMVRDGALAEYVLTNERSVVPVPDTVPFDIAAIVADGVSTPFHALRERGALRAGESVAVIGCGGLGTHAILLARLMGAGFIAAVDTQESARRRALALGADLAIDPASGEDPRDLIRRQYGRGVDLALEFVGREESVQAAIDVLDLCGRAVVVGVGMARPLLPPLVNFVGREYSIMGSFGMTKRDIADLLALIAAGRLDLSASVTERYPLQDVNLALQRLAGRSSEVVRLVVNP